jgi:hypothetical protein
MDLITEEFLASLVSCTSCSIKPGDGSLRWTLSLEAPLTAELAQDLGVSKAVTSQFEYCGLPVHSKAAEVRLNVDGLPDGNVTLHVDEANGFEIVALKDSGPVVRFKLACSGAVSPIAAFLEAVTSTPVQMRFRPLEVQTELPNVKPTETAAAAAETAAAAGGKRGRK